MQSLALDQFGDFNLRGLQAPDKYKFFASLPLVSPLGALAPSPQSALLGLEGGGESCESCCRDRICRTKALQAPRNLQSSVNRRHKMDN